MIKKVKIAVCDDNARDLAQTKAALDELKKQYKLDVHYYNSAEKLIFAANKHNDFTLAILEINTKGLDGVQLASRLREIIPTLEIAFLTTSGDFAVDAFGLNALHYILKPVSKEKIQDILTRFLIRAC